jgi:hypothetical protein
MVMFKVDVRLIAVKFSRLTLEDSGPCPVFAFALQLRKKHGENLSHVGKLGCQSASNIYITARRRDSLLVASHWLSVGGVK